MRYDHLLCFQLWTRLLQGNYCASIELILWNEAFDSFASDSASFRNHRNPADHYWTFLLLSNFFPDIALLFSWLNLFGLYPWLWCDWGKFLAFQDCYRWIVFHFGGSKRKMLLQIVFYCYSRNFFSLGTFPPERLWIFLLGSWCWGKFIQLQRWNLLQRHELWLIKESELTLDG